MIARRAKLEDAAVREQLRLLKQLRRDLLVGASDLVGSGASRTQQMLRVIDAEIRRLSQLAMAAVNLQTRVAFRAGADVVISVVPSLEHGLYGTSADLLRAVVDVTTDQIRAVWSEVGTRLKTTIRRVALGVTDAFEGTVAIARALHDPKTFGTTFARAETIVRTEVNRVFALATQDRMTAAEQALKKTGERLGKYWLTAADERVRDAHRKAGSAYVKSRAIQAGDAFVVDGEELMYPGDPNGSAANTINCRCTSVPVLIPATV